MSARNEALAEALGPPRVVHAGHCSCTPSQWFRCSCCGRRCGWCVGGLGDDLCSDCWVDLGELDGVCNRCDQAVEPSPKLERVELCGDCCTCRLGDPLCLRCGADPAFDEAERTDR